MFFVKCYDYKGILEGFFKKLRLCGMIGESMMKNFCCIGFYKN